MSSYLLSKQMVPTMEIPGGVAEVSAELPYGKLCAGTLYLQLLRKLWKKGQSHFLFLLCHCLTKTPHSIDYMEAVLMKNMRRMRPFI